MKILFSAYFHQKNFRKKLAESLLGSGCGSGRFRKSDPDPVKIRPNPQHWYSAQAKQIQMCKIMFAGQISSKDQMQRTRRHIAIVFENTGLVKTLDKEN
jgi:hypothetical protein